MAFTFFEISNFLCDDVFLIMQGQKLSEIIFNQNKYYESSGFQPMGILKTFSLCI